MNENNKLNTYEKYGQIISEEFSKFASSTNKLKRELMKNIDNNFIKALQASINHSAVQGTIVNVVVQLNVTEQFQKIGSLIHNALKSLDFISHRFNRIMVAIGWMPVDLIYMGEVNKIIELYDEKGIKAKSEIEEILVQNYDNETIKQILDSWEEYEWLSHRFRLMSIGVKAHMRGEYALSVPQLLTHVEGIVRDYFQYDTRVNQKVIKEDAKKIIYGFDEDGENQTWLSYEFNKATFEFYKGQIMAGFTDKPESEISRHAIFHGVDLDYDNVCNSLKIILLLDHMIAQINEMKKIEAKEVS